MATTTPNFGWAVPTSTDLVKDGAVAIETLGDAIDASLLDLKGGTTGQVLSKTSNTDMDFTWVAQDDSNAIQNAIVDAKGDIIAATAADTPARLAVGTNGQVLTADSTAATGLKWASTGAPTAQGVWATNAADLSIPSGTFTTITADSESFDTDGFHSTTTNTGRLTVPSGLGGKYIVSFNLYCTGSLATMWYGILQVNGSNVNRCVMKSGGGSESQTLAITQHLNLSAGDYVTIQVYQASGSTYTVSIGQYGGFGMMRIGA